MLVLDEADRLLDLDFPRSSLASSSNCHGVSRRCCSRRPFRPPFESSRKGYYAIRFASTCLRSPPRSRLSCSGPYRSIRSGAPRFSAISSTNTLDPDPGVRSLTRYATEHVAAKLRRAGIPAAALSGDLSQGARTKALADFKAGRIKVLIATDVAARGIDIEQLPAVVNFDLPRSTTDYVHRIGRTGRAGESGVAVSFVPSGFEQHFR